MGGTVGEIEFAKRRARNLFDEWNDVTGVIGKFSGYYYEVMACIDDAVDCGFQTALDDYKSLSDGEESTPPKSEEVEQSTSHNTDMPKLPDINECIQVAKDSLNGMDISSIEVGLIEVVHEFIAGKIGMS
jgi:hypothetical protein